MRDNILIRDMLPEDIDRRGTVHYQSWQESYRGIVNDAYLDAMSEENCQAIARKWPENTAVAVADGEIVGFVCWCPCRDSDMDELTGEISAIYVLEQYKGLGIGRALADYGIARLTGCRQVILWVFAENRRAVGFYEHYGFQADGVEKKLNLVTPARCIRMVKKV